MRGKKVKILRRLTKHIPSMLTQIVHETKRGARVTLLWTGGRRHYQNLKKGTR